MIRLDPSNDRIRIDGQASFQTAVASMATVLTEALAAFGGSLAWDATVLQ
ncbi:MAG: hypothetical protein JOZ87_35555 [Chloroflexi bacterium]|nr:hypothetical protein [Chloroflexota bacterium]